MTETERAKCLNHRVGGSGAIYPCKYAKWVECNGSWGFTGCYHEPFNGKWIAEIEKCPMRGGDKE